LARQRLCGQRWPDLAGAEPIWPALSQFGPLRFALSFFDSLFENLLNTKFDGLS
jgi:hypothetical protein